MSGGARVVGWLVVAVGAALGLLAVAWLLGARADGTLAAGGFALGLVLAALVVLPLLAVGVYLIAQGRAERREHAAAAQTRQLLNMVLTRGQVRIADAVVELGVPQEEVRSILYDAVGRGLFSGYINWREGVLYAREAAQGAQSCPNCGGTIELAGKGVFQCPYCGTEMFLAQGDDQHHEVRGLEPPRDWPGAADAGGPAGPTVTGRA
jgi:hypothetical protein